MHNKNIIAALGVFLSVGGWYLWNLLLSGTFTADYRIYQIRRAFLDNFGHTLNFWAVCLVALGSCIVLELLCNALRRVYFPNDVDRLQRMEREEKKAAKRARKLGAQQMEEGQGPRDVVEDLTGIHVDSRQPAAGRGDTTPAAAQDGVDPFEKGYGPTRRTKKPLGVVTSWTRREAEEPIEMRTPRGEGGRGTAPTA